MSEAGKRLAFYAMLGQMYADMGREMVTNGHAGPGDDISPFPAWVDEAAQEMFGDSDEWCREETCRHRHWRSGSTPTHRRGADCPIPPGKDQSDG